ncbi:MerR family transcriptional regulator [Paenibacillus sp. GCM10027627]|uniref:MerR family transcriptional regulator n=1 Tax=unclassified Paenibacillus TaxID=185978 RepID=UPI003626FDF1
MYTISRFSQLCKMSPRMLRHYDQERLLKPMHVDGSNGYRYYDKTQLETALLIKKLRDFRFSLPEIRTILETSDGKSTSNEEHLSDWMHCKIRELSGEMSQYKGIIAEMQGIIDQKAVSLPRETRAYDILCGMRNEVSVIRQRVQMNIAGMDKYVDSLYEAAEKSQLALLGAPSAIFWDEEFNADCCDVELMLPIALSGYAVEESDIHRLPKQLIAAALHIGTYDYIGYAHIALEEWIVYNGYEFDGPPYETYLKGPESECSPEEYVTQVCFPIVKK